MVIQCHSLALQESMWPYTCENIHTQILLYTYVTRQPWPDEIFCLNFSQSARKQYFTKLSFQGWYIHGIYKIPHRGKKKTQLKNNKIQLYLHLIYNVTPTYTNHFSWICINIDLAVCLKHFPDKITWSRKFGDNENPSAKTIYIFM